MRNRGSHAAGCLTEIVHKLTPWELQVTKSLLSFVPQAAAHITHDAFTQKLPNYPRKQPSSYWSAFATFIAS